MIKVNIVLDKKIWKKKLKKPEIYFKKKLNKLSKLRNFKNKNHELDKMWIHGYLHLLGYDHKKNKDYYLMKKKENLIFKKLNKIN